MVSDEKLLEEIRRLASNGNPPTRRQMSEDGKWHGNTVVHRFGTWNNAVRAAGFEVNNKPVPDEKLLEEIRRLASNETPPRQTDMDEDGKWSASTVINHFGTWNNAVREAGFEANLVDEYSKKELLQAIRGCSDGGQAPTKRRFDKTAGPTSETVKDNFGSWWKGVVQSGAVPHYRVPLTSDQFHQFHQATISRDDPKESLIGSFLLFTGLTAELIPRVKSSWFDHLSDNRYATTLTVPNEHLHSPTTSEWTIKLPTTYTLDNATRKTQLPSLAQWFFAQSQYPEQSLPSKQTVEKIPYRIARDAELPRKSVKRVDIGVCPDIPPKDLRASVGVQMARNGAPKRRIRRHLGIEHTGWDACVEDFFLWLYQFEDTVHPDYSPPDFVLDPVDPDSSAE